MQALHPRELMTKLRFHRELLIFLKSDTEERAVSNLMGACPAEKRSAAILAEPDV
jgi:hypothetical protein